MSSSQYFNIVKICIFFYGAELIGPLSALMIYEIFSDLQYEIQYLPRLGFSFFMARDDCWISIWYNPDVKGDLMHVQDRIY